MNIVSAIRRLKRDVDEHRQQLRCEHPESERLDMSVMGRPYHWVCRRCGHEEG